MQASNSITSYNISDHARYEMKRRQISEQDVAKVLAAPEQVITIRKGRKVYQSRIFWDKPSKIYLLRVFIDIDYEPPVVVTAYRTSKIKKYLEEK